MSRSNAPVFFPAVLLGGFLFAGCATGSNAVATGDPESDEVGVGYGTQDRSRVTGAVSSVDADDVRGRAVTRIEDLIAGRFAGVQVQRLSNGGLSIRIRGASSLMGDTEPLYVINGIPFEGPPGTALLAINPSEIERIDILKDAGSTAIYGSRGAHGVVIITTDRGN